MYRMEDAAGLTGYKVLWTLYIQFCDSMFKQSHIDEVEQTSHASRLFVYFLLVLFTFFVIVDHNVKKSKCSFNNKESK